MEGHKQIVDTWVKLEKCLAEFDTEVNRRQPRPMTSAAEPNRFQIHKKRPESSSAVGGPLPGRGRSTFRSPGRPLTAFQTLAAQNRPTSSLALIRPNTSGTIRSASKGLLAESLTFNRVINSLPLEQVIGLYEARCKDTQVE